MENVPLALCASGGPKISAFQIACFAIACFAVPSRPALPSDVPRCVTWMGRQAQKRRRWGGSLGFSTGAIRIFLLNRDGTVQSVQKINNSAGAPSSVL